ncbi:MAG TPA: HD domain-containing protein [Anaerovoracaceae bacterium]|nr:HD domain-containing protein [Anaerovoracaceae bacterium]
MADLIQEKLYVSMRYWLLGAKMHRALSALEFGAMFHTGVRKDGVTPEYKHQLSIGQYIRTFVNHLDHPEETLAAAFLHDVCEDYDVGFEEIETKFGIEVGRAVRLLSKEHRGDKTPLEVYYKEIGKNRIAAVVKGADRVNNIQTMVGVFSLEKQKKYIEETESLVLPMLKIARRNFPTQESAYENMKFVLRSQLELIQAIHKASMQGVISSER